MSSKSSLSYEQGRAYLRPLTSLRFFAALSIFFLHASNHSLFPSELVRQLDLSKAVSFFFVLSGFVLTYAYQNKPFSALSFYYSRLSRVWPITFISLLFVCFFLPASVYLPYSNSSIPIALVFFVHLLCLQSIIPIPSFYFGFNAVSWSISTELFFYSCFPFFLSLQWPKLRLVWLYFVLLSLVLSIISLFLDLQSFDLANYDQISWQGLIYISPFCRFQEFVSGIVAARLFLSSQFSDFFSALYNDFLNSIPLPASILDLSVVFLLIYSTTMSNIRFLPLALSYSLSQILSGIIFSFLILYILHSSSTFAKILGSKLFIFLGNISFSFYLFHQPIMIRSSQLGGITLAGYQLMPNNLFVVFLWTLAISMFSFAFLERPLRSYLASRTLRRFP
jgi:peptidoglycan/LPS O-acetylase OafA/YrhL